jgi:cytochrome b involved in lipid metabolism
MNKKFLPTVIFLAAAGLVMVVITLIANSGSQVPASNHNNPPINQSKNSPVANQPGVNPTANGQNNNPASSVAKTYTITEVSQHADVQSCWSVVHGNVYDLSSWISQHPGGERAILGMCGKDATDAFDGKHGGQPRPEQELAGFKIGTLAK